MNTFNSIYYFYAHIENFHVFIKNKNKWYDFFAMVLPSFFDVPVISIAV